MNTSNRPDFENLIESAREHEIDTSAAEFGFETRLAATIRDLKSSESSFLDVFGSWLWRSGLGLTPVVVLLIALAVLSNGLSIPEGSDGLVSYVVDALPGTTLFDH